MNLGDENGQLELKSELLDTNDIDYLLEEDRKKIEQLSEEDKLKAQVVQRFKGQQLIEKDHPLQDVPLTDIFPYLRICKCRKKKQTDEKEESDEEELTRSKAQEAKEMKHKLLREYSQAALSLDGEASYTDLCKELDRVHNDRFKQDKQWWRTTMTESTSSD